MRNAVLAGLIMCFAVTFANADNAPISLEKMGSFHIGGREVEISGKPVKEVVFSKGGVPAKVDPNGTYLVEGMYVQYFIPSERRGTLPLLMWHGGGMTGATYETTPDGREGWSTWFLRRGWSVYNSDAVERGRSGWAMSPEIFKGDPIFLARHDPFERFRIGAGSGSYNPDMSKARILPGSQFPVEAWPNFMKQIVPRWVTTDDAAVSAYTALVDRVCPCVVLAHSQGGGFAYKVAQANPDKVKALVLIEPSTAGDPVQAAKLKDTPILAIFGDFIEQDARWPKIRENGLKFLEAVQQAGGSTEVIDLPKRGLKGNSHFMMMDKNNTDISAIIQDWLQQKNFYQ